MLFGGNFFLTSPRLIKVLDFKAWRKVERGDRTRRRFSPRLTLEADGVLLNLVGYASVWDFLDAILDDLPRKPINQAMKGYDYYDDEVLPFANEVIHFLQESDKPHIGFLLDEIGNAKVVSNPLCNIPIRMKERADISEATLFHSSYTFVLLETKDKPRLYVVYCMGMGVRPLTGKVFASIDKATQYIINTSAKLVNTDTNKHPFTIRHGMFDEEVDKLENEAFFSSLSQE